MQDCVSQYQYDLVYVDDLLFLGKGPKAFFDFLTNEQGFELKGVIKTKYQQGGDLFRYQEGIVAWEAQTHVSKMVDNYILMYITELYKYSSLMHNGPFRKR
jgi:hypothetical protein